jgi:hypothetical protein
MMKTTIIGATLVFLLGACGGKEADKKPSPASTVNPTKTEAPTTKTPGKDPAPTDAKTTDAKPAAPEPARTTLLAIPDAELKCSSTETKITEFQLEGKKLDASGAKESYAYYSGTEQVLTISSKPLENKEKFVGFFDKSKLKKGEHFFFIAFNRRKAETSIAPELGVYKTMSDDPNNVFQGSLAVYTTDSAPPIPATNVVLEGISTTRVCGTFEFSNPDGTNTLKGTFNVPNTVR